MLGNSVVLKFDELTKLLLCLLLLYLLESGHTERLLYLILPLFNFAGMVSILLSEETF